MVESLSSTSAASPDPRHAALRSRPGIWASVGVLQTLLTAGIVFGWASLLPTLRDEGVEHTPQEFAKIFTCGAIGNYLSTLMFGLTLDRMGPRVTGILASILFGIGLLLCCHSESFLNLLVGIGLLGFSGPGVQMPTLHLANLFSQSGGGSAVYMSSQAAAFDGGTMVFAILRYLSHSMELSSAAFFQLYMIVPISVLVTAIFVWPDDVLEESLDASADPNSIIESPYVGAALSPYISPRMKLATPTSTASSNKKSSRNNPPVYKTLVNAPLNVVLRHPSFWTLATWVAIHILKLNFVVATLNDQLDAQVPLDQAESLINIFGAMLPFGFVALPLVAWMLNKSVTSVIQLANAVGMVYGGILVWCPSSKILMTSLVFPAVATSRQMVYSTVFHQIGAAFGFANYGFLLGLTNILVSSFSLLQNPLVDWSEQQNDYTTANSLLLTLTVPLFFVGFFANPKPTKAAAAARNAAGLEMSDEERQLLIPPGDRKPRSYSEA